MSVSRSALELTEVRCSCPSATQGTQSCNYGRRCGLTVNLSTVLYLGVFSRAEQRVLQAIFVAIADGGGRCVATLAMLAHESNTSKTTTRNAIARAVSIGLLEKIERRSYCAVSLPSVLTYGEALTAPHLKATHEASPFA
jgi:hypothetical protein